MLEEIGALAARHAEYLVLAGLGLVGLVVLWWWLNRPSKEEIQHKRRFEELKEQSRDKYSKLRPLK
jgi:type II secretory pathway component PulM